MTETPEDSHYEFERRVSELPIVSERRFVWSIWILSFGFVSDFDIRISDFTL